MRVATWNIGEDERNDDGKLTIDSYNYIIDTIREENIDVLCLQEAIIKSKHLPSIASYIKENTDLKYIIEYELSDSHINIGSKMGVVICSKHEIKNYKMVKLDNPNLVYSVNENKTYYSHDKGFIIANINEFNIISGHCLPFHVFKKNPLDYLGIFEKVEEEFIKSYNLNNNIILCGDFNYDNVNQLFPNIMKNCIDLIDCPTRKDKQLDHFIIGNNLKCTYKNINSNIFDHKLGIFDINVSVQSNEDYLNQTFNTYNKIAKKYEEEYGQDLSDTPYIDKFLKEMNNGKILDIGCGTGTLSEYIANKGFSVDAIDFSEEMLKIAKGKIKNVNFIQMDMRNINIDEKYNGIMLAYSLFHISKKEVKEVIPKYYNLLKENGTMLIILQEGEGEKYVDENLEIGLKKFVNYYSFEEIEKILKDNHFEIIEKFRKKPLSEFSLQNDKLIIICRKK